MPTILREAGFRFLFYSREGQEPPHIHVIGHDGEMKVWLNDLTVAKVYSLSPKHQKRALEIIEINKELFVQKWREYHG
jgi:hypothetical protein